MRSPEVAPRLGEWLRAARGRLEAAGLPAGDAERLAAVGFGVAWGDLWSRLDEPARCLDAFLERRLGGEPLAYIEGSAVFYGHEVACGPGVLVPRPETETLVEVALDLIAGLDAPVVVDVGTGTGCIALAIARARPDARVVAVEIDPDALAYARRNLERVGLVRGDLLTAVRRADLVVSNPPYVALGVELPADVSSEPERALFAGPDGDDVIVALLAQARTIGVRHIAVEVGTPEQAERVRGSLGAPSRVTEDHTGRPRVVSL